jgi:uncharacterized protein
MLLVKTWIGMSSIHGIGLFADEFIPKGSSTWEFLEGFDLRLSPSVLERLSVPARTQFLHYSYFHADTGLYELCSDDARFFNHSDTPNTASFSLSSGDEVDRALRDIADGEEITCDYRKFDPDWQTKLGLLP